MGRRKKRKLDGHYQAEDRVSVWLGTFPDEASCEAYFKEGWDQRDKDDFPTCRVWQDLGIQWFDHDSEEGGFVSDTVPIEELLGRGWSYAESFRGPLLAACRAKGIEKANAVMFLFDYDYPEEVGYSSPHLKFVGV